VLKKYLILNEFVSTRGNAKINYNDAIWFLLVKNKLKKYNIADANISLKYDTIIENPKVYILIKCHNS